jgi:hypothetical protein
MSDSSSSRSRQNTESRAAVARQERADSAVGSRQAPRCNWADSVRTIRPSSSDVVISHISPKAGDGPASGAVVVLAERLGRCVR